ncbi:hypothetical protein C3941_00495 [Kaistia algarum]|uniref:hypothetical protein n=1 Tax=Kaistia algarum TaxID=2083279 RepID=UPI000CE78ACE|nr:hypothetical protein [Kaistia algarum]MCX5513304.1 hypothetical protein [Kaistia algarum]PPE81243.1 hypothetical protein C3941_00495 [Kaistia algarum]
MEQIQQKPGNFSVSRIVGAAYADSWRAARAIPLVVFTTFLLLLLIFAVRSALGLQPDQFLRDIPLADRLALSSAAQPFLFAVALATISLQIAIHRYVLCEQQSSACSASLRRRQFWKYTAFVFVFQLTSFGISYLYFTGIVIICPAAGLFMMYIKARFSPIFPAIAICDDRNISYFFRLSKGRFWKIFIVSIFCSTPSSILLFVPGAVVSYLDTGQLVMGLLAVFLYATSALVTCMVTTAAASHIYRALEYPSAPMITKLEQDNPATVVLAAP